MLISLVLCSALLVFRGSITAGGESYPVFTSGGLCDSLSRVELQSVPRTPMKGHVVCYWIKGREYVYNSEHGRRPFYPNLVSRTRVRRKEEIRRGSYSTNLKLIVEGWSVRKTPGESGR